MNDVEHRYLCHLDNITRSGKELLEAFRDQADQFDELMAKALREALTGDHAEAGRILAQVATGSAHNYARVLAKATHVYPPAPEYRWKKSYAVEPMAGIHPANDPLLKLRESGL